MSISDIPKIFSKYFPDNWDNSEKYQYLRKKPKEENEDLQKFQIDLDFKNLSAEIIKILNLSLLSGEYVKYVNKSEELPYIKSTIFVDDKLSDALDFNIKQHFNNSGRINYIEPIRVCLDKYGYLIKILQKKFSNQDHIVVYEKQDDQFKNSLGLQLTDYVSTFLINLQLCEIDHFLAIDKGELPNLAKIKKELESIRKNHPEEENQYIEIILDKCNFLLKKVLCRLDEDEKSYYVADYQNKELKKENLAIVYFKKFDDIVCKFGDKSREILLLSPERKSALNKKPQERLTFIEHYYINKEYRVIESKPYLLQAANRKFVETYGGPKQNACYDDYAYSVSYNYLKNNELSALIENDATINEVEQKLKEIHDIQVKTHIKNYRPFLDCAKYIDKKIDELFSESGSSVEIEELIKKLGHYNKIIYDNLRWCQFRKFLAFQSPLDECLVKSSDIELPNKLPEDLSQIYIASSFVLPIDYKQVQESFQRLSTFTLHKHKAMCDAYKKIESQKQNIDKILTDVTTIKDESQKKSIELLSIFTAIIAFVVGGIGLFSKTADINIMTIIMSLTAFAAILLLFIFSLRLITWDGKGMNRNQWIVNSVFVLVLILLISAVGTYVINHPHLPKGTPVSQSNTNSKDDPVEKN